MGNRFVLLIFYNQHYQPDIKKHNHLRVMPGLTGHLIIKRFKVSDYEVSTFVEMTEQERAFLFNVLNVAGKIKFLNTQEYNPQYRYRLILQPNF